MTDGAAPDPMVPQPYRVGSVRFEADDVATLELAPVSGTLPRFLPGQFNMLYLFGVGEIPIGHSGDPADRRRITHTVHAVGAVSTAMAKLERGAVIGVRGPFGVAWPVEEAEGSDVVFVAGGLGLSPLRPAIFQVLAHRERYGRVVLLYGARSPSGILYRHDLEDWRRRLDVEIEVTVDHSGSDWRGNVGVVPALIPRAKFDPDKTIAMTCGPEVMMRFTVKALAAAGVPLERTYVSMERNMKCAIGLCGHCQFGPTFVCKDGPVIRFDRIAEIFTRREI